MVVDGDDSYHLTPEGIKGPPKGWGRALSVWGWVRFRGSGLFAALLVVRTIGIYMAVNVFRQ